MFKSFAITKIYSIFVCSVANCALILDYALSQLNMQIFIYAPKQLTWNIPVRSEECQMKRPVFLLMLYTVLSVMRQGEAMVDVSLVPSSGQKSELHRKKRTRTKQAVVLYIQSSSL